MNKFENLTIRQQIHLLKNKGLIFKNEEKARQVLRYISYYKIKEYAMPFYTKESKFEKDTYFEDILKKIRRR